MKKNKVHLIKWCIPKGENLEYKIAVFTSYHKAKLFETYLKLYTPIGLIVTTNQTLELNKALEDWSQKQKEALEEWRKKVK